MSDAFETPRLVRDLMTVGVATCLPDTLLPDLARLFAEKGLEEVVVLEEGNALGIVGQQELLHAFAARDWRNLKAEDVLREDILEVPADIPLEAAAQVMLDNGVRALFYMHHAAGIEYPAAVITFRHLVRLMGARSPEELSDLGIKAERQSPLEVFIQRREAAREAARKARRHG